MRRKTKLLMIIALLFYMEVLLGQGGYQECPEETPDCSPDGMIADKYILTGAGTIFNNDLQTCISCPMADPDCSEQSITIEIAVDACINLGDQWDFVAIKDLSIIIKGDPGSNTTGKLRFSGQGINGDQLLLNDLSTLIIENANPEDLAIDAAQSQGGDRICFFPSPGSLPSSCWKGNQFDDIISAGGVDGGGLLPIELLSFQATPRQGGVHLSWATATETGNDYFDVEHSRTGEDFIRIGGRKGAGTSLEVRHYSLQHADPPPGVNYYRLKQVDFDGRFTYSPVVTVRVDGGGSLTLAPNPAKRRLNIYVPDAASEAQIEVYNLLGKAVRPLIQRNGAMYELVLPADLPAGQYLVRVTQGAQRFVEMVVVR
jgi:hypothetical protein